MVEYAIPTAFKNADDYNAYDYFVCKNGEPVERAKKIIQDPAAMLADFAEYFDGYKGLKIAAISDTDGSSAVPMAFMGAEVTVFGVFEEAKKYALKTAEAAGVQINYEVYDFLEMDERFFDSFDAVVIKGAAIHYFYDIETFFGNIRSMLKTGGKLVCIDFHPFYKEGVCRVSKHLFSSIQRQLPETSEKRFSLTDILQAVSLCGLKITAFDEETVNDEMGSETRACLTAEKV
ncbi:MAG: class I SAM-dependent methyltransferase [Oscillospiraceae bacterium]|nr:class I SAM-dependent methyltransferase [Oscillospiraceae bacterium]